jgi:hypothetical protein
MQVGRKRYREIDGEDKTVHSIVQSIRLHLHALDWFGLYPSLAGKLYMVTHTPLPLLFAWQLLSLSLSHSKSLSLSLWLEYK